MQKYLFVDNFRGFSNTYVPIVDVTFLVGENSTGKTSLLGLIKLFSSPRLFMGPEFSAGAGDETQFGHFNEMVSAHAQDKSYFRIGLIEERPTPPKGSLAVTGILLTYKERSGLPEISRLTWAMGDREVHVRFDDSGVSFKVKSLSNVATTEDMNKVVPQWINEHTEDDTHDWTQVVFPDGFREAQVPLFMIMSFVVQQQAAATKDPSSIQLFMPHFGPQLVWIAPIRTKPRRTYDEPQSIAFSSEGAHTPYLIKKMLDSKAEAEKFTEFIRTVGDSSGLFQSIKINRFGKGPTAPFEVDALIGGKALNLSTVGYGVSQSLPIFVEVMHRPPESWFAIQQPEVHLHPRAQAALGDVFFEMSTREKKCFLIETHSDFTIDRFRMKYREKRTKKPNGQVLFFERCNNCNRVTALPISNRGELPRDQPESYRRFFIKEEMDMLSF